MSPDAGEPPIDSSPSIPTVDLTSEVAPSTLSVNLAARDQVPTAEAIRQQFHSSQELPDGRTRRRLAYALVFILAAIVVVSLVVLFMSQQVGLRRAKDLIGLVLTPIVGLVGSVVGFYFGARTAEQAGSPSNVPTD